MGFFGEFDEWLTNLLARYITDNTAAMARVLEPAIVTLGVLYIVVWGYLHLMGKIEQPFIEGVKRLLTMALILGVSLQFWLYNEVIVNTFFSAPASLAAGVIGAPTSAGIVDEILFDGDDAASLLLAKGGFFDDSFTFYVAGFAVYLIVGLTAVYTMFLLALSKIALSVLIALGPVFFALLFFESTKRFFESWIAQLSNYAFLDDSHRDGRVIHAAGGLRVGAGGGGRGRWHRDRACGERVRGGGAHFSHHETGPGDGAGTRERRRAIEFRRRVAPGGRGMGCGAWSGAEREGFLARCIRRSRQESMGQHEPEDGSTTRRRAVAA